MNEDDRKQAKAVKKEKRKAFRRLAVRALPEIRTFQMFTKLTIMLLTVILAKIVTRLLESTSDGRQHDRRDHHRQRLHGGDAKE